MNSVLEQQRRLHEERERIEDAILKELLLKKASVRGINFTRTFPSGVLCLLQIWGMF